ncbi:DNA/RNA helicase [Paenibacillus sp. PK3_47]|uniref:DEAD/DEAH box helicase n=1 Tax=Paenibacillus sp. PK3_47 TaxID=2072642 RepID=UPI00201D3F2F|nr:helicase-related protein [Paenibacillus sp. PK3_47]UQZ33853.1 DNA/RNA helicase [Paenibacillus sp. PK3_47]
MKVAVYAVNCGGSWGVCISLNIQVDYLWWMGAGGSEDGWNTEAVERLVLLSPAVPLGWAVKLRGSFRSHKAMSEWEGENWRSYAADILKEEIKEEIEAGGVRPKGWPFGEIAVMSSRDDLYGRDEGVIVDQPALGMATEQIAAELEGCSLLQPEAEALVAERLPWLAGQWREAVQLAHLQGRLILEAGISGEAGRSCGGNRRSWTMWGADGRAMGGLGWRSAALRLPQLRLPWRGAAARRASTRCLRCGSAPTGRTACAACGLAGCAYCEACLALGRSRSCALLLRSAPLPAVRCTAGAVPTAAARRWGLSAAQAGAAGAALGFLAERRERSAEAGPERFLLWAVTGAGKTEITFPLLEAVLAAGGRALVATPRRDVVLELAPRLARAFPGESPVVLYGGSTDRWARGRLIIATTHQLLRFYQSFDLVILDEVDAFPYHNDPRLAFAAEHACKQDGSFIYLSATPPRELQRKAGSGRLPHARVPVRYHGHPLPVPRHITMIPVNACLKRRSLPRALLQALQRSLIRGAQIFLFVSRIAHIAGLLSLLRSSFPEAAIEGTSSQDPARTGKVEAFRARSISMLITTTILERGVTVPRSDVFILDADSSLFDEASLVQMAGRAGRSAEDPAGLVMFFSPQWTKSQRGALSQIRTMNAIARKQGYIKK